MVRQDPPEAPGAHPDDLGARRRVGGHRGLPADRQAAELTNIGILLAFVVVCVAVILLRYRKPDLPRFFRCPGMPVVPAIGVVFAISGT
jgi:hypothetical protein